MASKDSTFNMNTHNIAIEEESIITSNFNEEKWVTKMKSLLIKQNPQEIEIPFSIFKVPNSIKSFKPQPYTPQLIALGPYHNFHPKLYKSQSFKLYQAQIFHQELNLPRFEILSNQIGIKLIDVQSCYNQHFQISDQALSWMMVIDGLFLLSLISKQGSETELFDKTGRKFNVDSILNDSVKVENQIPFFVLEHLVARRGPNSTSRNTSLLAMAIRFCSRVSPVSLEGISKCSPEVKRMRSGSISRKVSRVLGAISGSDEEDTGLIPSATQLLGLKVKFFGGFGIASILFREEDASFRLPCLCLNFYSDVVMRNLIMYEAMLKPESPDLSQFIEMMAAMIRTIEDVEVLRRKGVLKHKGDSGEVVKLFKEIGEECNNNNVVVSKGKSELIEGVIKGINEYYYSNWRTKLKLILKKYVYSSWKMFTIVATLWLLLLTTIQTFCSICSCPNFFKTDTFASTTSGWHMYLDA